MSAPFAADVRVLNHGSVFTVEPLTPAAKAWIDDHVAEATWIGNSMGCEARFIDDLVDGMTGDGLSVVSQ